MNRGRMPRHRAGDDGCAVGFGGRIVARDSVYNDGLVASETADCTGNPGR